MGSGTGTGMESGDGDGCSNHMSGNRKMFTKLDEKFKENVKLGNDSSLKVQGKGDVKSKVNGAIQIISAKKSEALAIFKKFKAAVEKEIAYSPQQNGVAEKKNRFIMNMVRSMLILKKVPKFLGQK
ncbi:unnamed protein product [Prunus armeniaca]